jgi:VWFA-related protein
MDALASVVRQLATLPRRSLISTGAVRLVGSADATTRSVQDQFTALVRLAQREGVVFYAFDPALMGDFSSAGQTNLRVLAEETGGFANVNNNTFEPGVARVLAESGHHYLLVYASPAAADGRYHRISVETTRPGFVVRARRGYQSASVK